jgi:hypothetical protein
MTSRSLKVWLVVTLLVASGFGYLAIDALRGSEAARAHSKTLDAARTTQTSSRPHPEPSPGRRAERAGLSRVRLRGSVVGPEREAVTDGVVCLLSREADGLSACVKLTDSGRFELETDASATDPAALSVGARGFLDKITNLSSEQLDGTDSIVVTLQRAQSNLRGRVLDATGGTIAGATVRVQTGGVDETGQKAAEKSANALLAATITDELGRFQMSLPAEFVRVTAGAEGYSQISAQLMLFEQSERVIDLALAPASVIVGRVLDKESSAPIPEISVQAQRIGTVVSSQGKATTDSEGRFRILDLPAGSYRLTLQSSIWTVSPTTVPVGASNEASADLLAERAGSVVIRVKASNGQECASGFAALDGASLTRVPIDKGGQAIFGGVVPGNYRATISCDSAESITQDVNVKAGEQSEVTVEARALATVRGRLTYENQPVSGSIDVTLASATGTSSSCSGEEGAFSCKVGAGTYSCFATANGKPITREVQVELEAGDSVQVELPLLEARGNVELTLQQEGAGDANLASLLLRSGDGTFIHGMNFGDGIYRFAAVALGRYDVVLASPTSLSVGSIYLRKANETVKEKITLEARHSVYGSVIDSQGEPVPDAWVALSPLNAPRSRTTSVLTDASGAFRFDNLVAGTYRVAVESPWGGAQATMATETDQAMRVTILSPDVGD